MQVLTLVCITMFEFYIGVQMQKLQGAALNKMQQIWEDTAETHHYSVNSQRLICEMAILL